MDIFWNSPFSVTVVEMEKIPPYLNFYSIVFLDAVKSYYLNVFQFFRFFSKIFKNKI